MKSDWRDFEYKATVYEMRLALRALLRQIDPQDLKAVENTLQSCGVQPTVIKDRQ